MQRYTNMLPIFPYARDFMPGHPKELKDLNEVVRQVDPAMFVVRDESYGKKPNYEIWLHSNVGEATRLFAAWLDPVTGVPKDFDRRMVEMLITLDRRRWATEEDRMKAIAKLKARGDEGRKAIEAEQRVEVAEECAEILEGGDKKAFSFQQPEIASASSGSELKEKPAPRKRGRPRKGN